MIVAAIGGDLELAPGPGPNVVLAHQSGHPLAANPVAFSLQAGVHARAAIGLPALAVNCLDLLDQSAILGRPGAPRPPPASRRSHWVRPPEPGTSGAPESVRDGLG